MCLKEEAWEHRVHTLAKISKRHPQPAYAGLVMLLHIKWQYLQMNILEIGTLMDFIEYSLRDALFPALFGGEEVRADLREILGQSMKHGGLGIPDSRLLVECVYNISKADRKVLVGSLLGGTNLNYVEHKDCIHRSIVAAWKQEEYLEK